MKPRGPHPATSSESISLSFHGCWPVLIEVLPILSIGRQRADSLDCSTHHHQRTGSVWFDQVHVLIPNASLLTISSTFNSLFKVLCIFPSRYLFAIGLSPLFSFTWNLPRILGCTLKQPDSSRWQCYAGFILGRIRGSHPLRRLLPENLYRGSHEVPLTKLQFGRVNPPDFKFELFPLHSPLLWESWLVSFPLLIDMLKFSRWSCLIWDRSM